MKKIGQAQIEVYEYNTIGEMAEHIVQMEARGYTTQFSGQVYVSDSSKLADYLDEANWVFRAEFNKEIE